ncbi:MAG: hypothetical protein RMK29_09370 [Myxococcales bacterium]|nr:hypothetical protein [Myxococcota bacterium]MDW8281909.1 hypothetical protein [Myxococcales bacterium]
MTTLSTSTQTLWEQLRQRPLRQLCQPARLGPLLDAVLGPTQTAELLLSALRTLRPVLASAARSDPWPLSAYIPDEARQALATLCQRPLRLPPELAQALLSNPTLEEVLRDLLYEALREFNDRVNPFFADWGLPALIRKAVPLGGAALVRTLQAVRAEFDRRLEPETRRFLHGFVRRALRHAAHVLAEGRDSAQARALRLSLLEVVLAQPVSCLARVADDEALELLEVAAGALLRHVLPSEQARTLRHQVLSALAAAGGDLTLGEWLERHGLQLTAESLGTLLELGPE